MITLKHVAELAGVSTSTVSRVVSGKDVVSKSVKDKVEKAIKKTGYIPNVNARALANKNSTSIGLVTPDLSLAFFGTLAAGVIDAADDLGVTVDICNSRGKDQNNLNAVKTLIKRGFNNILLDESHCAESKILELCAEVPGLVLMNRFIPQIAERCVCVDNVTGGNMAASYLLDNLHNNIAFITSNSEIADPFDRIHGAKIAMAKRGIDTNNCLVAQAAPTIDGGKQAVLELLNKSDEFTAILAYNDNMAVGAMNELQDRGVRIPDEISVIGFDDLAISTVCRPALTTMHYPIREMADYAVKLSLDLTSSKKTLGTSHKFIPKLIERSSVSKI